MTGAIFQKPRTENSRITWSPSGGMTIVLLTQTMGIDTFTMRANRSVSPQGLGLKGGAIVMSAQ